MSRALMRRSPRAIQRQKRRALNLHWSDRLILAIAPQWGAKRVRARLAAQALARSFDATGGGRRTSGWSKNPADANAAHGPHLSGLRNISRDLRRNNGWARRAIDTIAHATVGWGIEAKAVASPRTAARALQLWREWSESTACDFDGRLSFTGIQRLVMETVAESGECLILGATPQGNDHGLPIPLQLRVVEPDLIDASRDGYHTRGGGYTMQGIEFDADGRRVAYWLFPQHPGGVAQMIPRMSSVRVPAEEVIHVYRVERPGQQRGVPWLATAISRLHDLDDYADALLMQQKVAACFSAFVEDLDGSGTAIGGQTTDDQNATPELEALEPGHIAYLSPGQKISVATPNIPNDQGFQAGHLRVIAASVGVTYEDLTGDYSKVNFSSARMGRLAHYQHVHDWRWNMLIPQMCAPVWSWVMRLGRVAGRVPSVPSAEWSPPPMPMLEPEKEGLAYQRLVRSGAMTLYQMIRERGEDPESHLQEIAEANARLDKLGIVLDSDARRVTAQGMAQPDDPADDDGEPDAGQGGDE